MGIICPKFTFAWFLLCLGLLGLVRFAEKIWKSPLRYRIIKGHDNDA